MLDHGLPHSLELEGLELLGRGGAIEPPDEAECLTDGVLFACSLVVLDIVGGDELPVSKNQVVDDE